MSSAVRTWDPDRTRRTGKHASRQRHRAVSEATGDRYQMGLRIGNGASGTVYQAIQLSVGRMVAVKVLDEVDDLPVRARFHQEGRLMAEVTHPNVVRVFAFEKIDGRPALVMEYLPGGTLRDLLQSKGCLALPEAMHILMQCLSGLQALHEAGLVHRDLKPENILFDAAGTPKLADLGIARNLHAVDPLTRDGTILGTPRYMAPEMILGEPASAASDLYAMGLIVHEMLAGAPVFAAPTPRSVFAQHLNEAPPPLYAAGARVPVALGQALQRLLAKTPSVRPASAASLVAELSVIPWEGRSPLRVTVPSVALASRRPRTGPGSGRVSFAPVRPPPRDSLGRRVLVPCALALVLRMAIGLLHAAIPGPRAPAAEPVASPGAHAAALAERIALAARHAGFTACALRRLPDRTPADRAALRAALDRFCRRELGGDPDAFRTEAAAYLADPAVPVAQRARLHELVMELAILDSVAEQAGAGTVLGVDAIAAGLIPVAHGAAPPTDAFRPIPRLDVVRESGLLATTHLGLVGMRERRTDVELIVGIDPALELVQKVARALDTGVRGTAEGTGHWFALGTLPDEMPIQRGFRLDIAVANHAPGSVFWLKVGGARIGLRSSADPARPSPITADTDRAALEARSVRLSAEVPAGVAEPGDTRLALAVQAPPLKGGTAVASDQVILFVTDLAIRTR